MARKFRYLLFLSAIVGILSNCVAGSKVRKKRNIELPPLVFRVSNGKVVSISNEDDEELFKKASSAYKRGQFQLAAKNFEKLVRTFPNSSLFESALYNLGLSYEQVGNYSSAVKVYRRLLGLRGIDSELKRDTQFRLAYTLNKVKNFKESLSVYLALEKLEGLEVSDRIEIFSQVGINLWSLGNFGKALNFFRRAVSLYVKNRREEDLEENFFVAQAYFYIGLYYDRQFRERKFRTKVSDMREDLEFKARSILAAQSSYIRSIKVRNSEWTVRSLYRIGAMYRQLYDDLMGAPTTGLKADELPVYYKMLRQKIRVLLKKAIYAYEKNLVIAAKLGLKEHPIVERTRRELEELRDRIVREFYSDSSDSGTEELEER